MPIRRKSRTGRTKAISTAAAPRSGWRRRRTRGITDSGCTITGGPRISVPSRVSCDHFEESLDRRAEGSHTNDDHHRDEPDHETVLNRGGATVFAQSSGLELKLDEARQHFSPLPGR